MTTVLLTSGTTWIVPGGGITSVTVACYGSGAGGGKGKSGTGADGGGSGGYVVKTIACSAGDVATISVGSPGAGSTIVSQNGANGGAVTFALNGSTLHAGGGVGGNSGSGPGGSDDGGTATGGDTNTPGNHGEFVTPSNATGGKGGDCPGPAGGLGGLGGTSSSAATDGAAYGAGGGGGYGLSVNLNGAAGHAGAIIINYVDTGAGAIIDEGQTGFFF